METPTKLRRALAMLAAAGLLAGAGAAAAQTGLQYSVVKDSVGAVVTQLSGNGVSVAGQPVALVTCPGNAVYSGGACQSGGPPTSVVGAPSLSAPAPSLASRTPNIACAAPKVPTLWGGTWTCLVPSWVKAQLAY